MDLNSVKFHNNVKAKRPDQPLAPNTFWVGVLHDSKTFLTADYDTDILWIKCRGHTKIDSIKKQCRLRSNDSHPILLRHENLILDSATTIGELDSFSDGVIALESIKQSGLGSSTSPPRRDPLRSLSTLASVNRVEGNIESLIKPEPRHWPSDVENRIHSPKLSGPEPTCKHESFPPLPELSHAIQTVDAISQDYLTECAKRDYVHEHLTDLFHGCMASDVSIEHHRNEYLAQWQIMLPEAQKWYKKRAVLFTGVTTVSETMLREELSDFTNHNAGFYQYFFSRKAIYGVYMDIHGSDQAFIMMKQDWDRLNKPSKNIWIEQGRKIRHSLMPPIASTDLPSIRTIGTPSPLHDNTPLTALAADQPEPKVLPQLSLQSLFAESTPELLENAMQQGVRLLEDLKEPLGRVAVEDATQWLQAIEKVQGQAAQPKTIVGVVGNTGAGKSSVINAMLDEERLVPTNCMRACTAVVTEISYNTGVDPYRAEIEFITREDWERELRVLFQDLFDGSGNVSREATNEESEAGVAYAKIKAVYPNFTREMLQKSTVEELMGHPNVQNVLGGNRQIAASDSLRFYKKLQYFVDSKEKTTGERSKDKKKASKELEFWPLIKVVRLYVKAEALSTGAVIVDLPGVHDSNAARSAVAEGYMKQCTGLWIVAPITRAVDDKAAKSLLGDTFKRQLKMDGGFNTVTFICSKTDDISLIECQESLGLEEEMGAHWAKSDELAKEKQELKRRLEELKETKAVYTASADDVDELLEVWETLRDDFEDGKTVFAPQGESTSKKRKRGLDNKVSKGRKKARTPNSDGQSDYVDSDESGEESDEESDSGEKQSEEPRAPLTKDEISEKISELKTTKKESRRQKQELEVQIQEIRAKIVKIDEADAKIEAEMRAKAISGRNDYSRGAIQQDFAAGVKELDQELAEEEDAANFNPDVDARDYDKVAQSLPVFCVSSRAYQKLRGRLRKEADIPGFQAVEETEIPQLQAHCKKLTEVSREANSRRFLNSLNQLLNSLRLWSSPDGDGSHLTEGQKAQQSTMIQNKIQKLESELGKQVGSVHEHIRQEFDDNIFDACEDVLTPAAIEANKAVLRWGAPVNRNNRAFGGYMWATYKAICRRNGVYTNGQGPHDWNAELIEPVIKAVASGWEKTFSRRISSLLQRGAADAGRLLKSFHEEIEQEASRSGRVANLHLLSHQLGNYQELLKDICNENMGMIVTQSKEINRMFQPVIATALEPAYATCVAERGSGSFMRMKAAMSAHVEKARWTMFHESVDAVERALEDMVRSMEAKMLFKTQEILTSVNRDYTSAVGGSFVATSRTLTPSHRNARQDVFEKVNAGEVAFKRLVDPEYEEDQPKPERNSEDPPDPLSVDETSRKVPADSLNENTANVGEALDTIIADPVIEEASQDSFVPLSDDLFRYDSP